MKNSQANYPEGRQTGDEFTSRLVRQIRSNRIHLEKKLAPRRPRKELTTNIPGKPGTTTILRAWEKMSSLNLSTPVGPVIIVSPDHQK